MQEEFEHEEEIEHEEEFEYVEDETKIVRRFFGVVLVGRPDNFQNWINVAKTCGLNIIYVKSLRLGRICVRERSW
jgi:hypothetical protein